ncbi:hypothetical protein F5J12DRAFT_891979 [Pisolithus orientalis]|uniref:uncharacterized protein n=1 Tax=Pisolithus orientalis TaxID=936130 RepID=UPI0022249346|nr:uncharacterized protein F5J12DRAFT_891979 [Pisolithus orientalis]KAI6008823.1 hypothetical protein F5J12DRAFT_891979 [Pisolithus orientalis]
MGKKVQVGTSAVQPLKASKASPSKRVIDDDDNDNKVKVVKSQMHAKGKGPVRGGLDSKVTANLLQSLRLLHTEATASQATYLQLQVHINQLTEALEKIGVE